MRLHRIAVHASSLGFFLTRASSSAFTFTYASSGGSRIARNTFPFSRRCSSSSSHKLAARNPFPFSRRCSSSSSHKSAASENDATLPTIEQAAKDPFMAQLSHAGEICALLEKSDGKASTLASDLLTAQMSHSDGVRGFFATYLTGEGDDTAADREEIPEPLAGAMHKADMNLLVPLACMNVVMPTAMSSMHTDPELSANAARTARRGIRVLKYLQDKNESVKTNCDAIRAVAAGDDTENCDRDEERVEYWTKFFENYGYGEKEKEGIAQAMETLS